MSLNEQFNQHYDEMIDTVKSRAIWRVGEQVVEGETFHNKCSSCGFESLHQRFDITRHRLLFGKSIRTIEAPRPMIRCRRCQHQGHLRDLGELVVPSTIALFNDVSAGAVAHLASGPADGAALPSELDMKIAAFREEASGPVRQRLLTEIAAASPAATAGLDDVGRALFLARDQITAAVEASAQH